MKTKLVQRGYKVFEGRYNSQMPKLVQEGMQPLTNKDVIQYRLQALQGNDKDEIKFWLHNYWDTVDGLAYYKEQLIVVPNSKELLSITLESKLSNGSLILTPEQYKKLAKEHEVIKRSKIKSNTDLTKQEAKQHPIWVQLAQEDKSLLNEYADAIFAKAKEVYNYDKIMGVYLPDDQKAPVMRGWCLGYLFSRSRAGARGGLGYVRLLGVRAQNFGSLLEKIAKEAEIMSLQEVRKALEFYKSGKSGKLDLELLQ